MQIAGSATPLLSCGVVSKAAATARAKPIPEAFRMWCGVYEGLGLG
jgi:hypothetical protein